MATASYVTGKCVSYIGFLHQQLYSTKIFSLDCHKIDSRAERITLDEELLCINSSKYHAVDTQIS